MDNSTIGGAGVPDTRTKYSSLSFANLRSQLIGLTATGEGGFEGLVAAACSQLVGVPFRLVVSGRQFGRDGEGILGGTAIFFEAKRYDSRLSYSDLSTKLQESLDRSGRPVEVWGAASTVPLDAIDGEDLRKLGEDRGVTVLLLDWAQPLPPLAVLLASAGEASLDWFARNAPALTEQIALALDDVRNHVLYSIHRDSLARELRQGTLGLALARKRNAGWMEQHFGDRISALHEFNQPLAPLDQSLRPLPFKRTVLENQIQDLIVRWTRRPEFIVLTGAQSAGANGLEGDEGVGKSWAIARSWLTLANGPKSNRPLFLFMASHMWRDGDELAPMRLLARLLAIQTGSPSHETGVWERRLTRWLNDATASNANSPVLIIVLDGVNERGNQPWPALVSSLALLAQEKPIRLVVTTRRGVYDRDLAPFLKRLEAKEIIVEAISNEDLDHVLQTVGREPVSVKEPLRSFLRNPRVLSVGIELLDRLDPDEVGVDRLLFEYLRKRQEERAPHVSHTPDQFAQTLVKHAREIRQRLLQKEEIAQSQVFDEETLTSRLGVPPTRNRLVDDLHGIVDSQFLRITDRRRNRYAFTAQALPLGLGLLLVDELDQAVQNGETRLERCLDAIIDPIRSIEATSRILLAALDVALADIATVDTVAEALLHQLLVMQNVPAKERARIFAGRRERITVYINVADRLYGNGGRVGRRDWMLDALVDVRFEHRTSDILDSAIRRWLRSWQPVPIEPDLSRHTVDQAADVRASHEKAAHAHFESLAQLTETEKFYIERELIRLPADWEHGVDEIAIALLAGRELLPFSEELFAWNVATAAGWNSGGMLRQMGWLLRLAPLDWNALSAETKRQTRALATEHHSQIFQWAMFYAQMNGGDPEGAVEADKLWALLSDAPQHQTFYAFDDFCDVEPLDPLAPRPKTDLCAASECYRRWASEQTDHPTFLLMRTHDSATRRVQAILCRFQPQVAADCHRIFARRAPSAVGAAPGVLVDFVVHDTAILERDECESLLPWFEALCAEQKPKDKGVAALLLTALMPRLEASSQLDAYSRLSEDAFWLEAMTMPLPSEEIPVRLRDAMASNDKRLLRLSLTFVAATKPALEIIRPAIALAIADDDPELRSSAFRAIVMIGENVDFSVLNETGWRWNRIADENQYQEGFFGSICLVNACSEFDDPTVLERIHPAAWNLAVERGDARIAEAVAKRIGRAIAGPSLKTDTPAGIAITVVRSDDVTPRHNDLTCVGHTISFSLSDEFKVGGAESSRRLDMRDYFEFGQRLLDQEREALLYPLSSASLDRLANLAPAAFAALVAGVEGHFDDHGTNARVMLALDIARFLSTRDPARAVALFQRYESEVPLFREIMPISRLPRTALLLWTAADLPEIVAVRNRRLDSATNDEDLAFEVLAAETADKHKQIVAYVRDRMTSRHPAILARAITVAGFADEDDALLEIFDDERFRHGFLADVRSSAKQAYDKARWAKHWYRAARNSVSPLDIWRFGELALACADARSARWIELGRGVHMFEGVKPIMRNALQHAAEVESRNRRRKLFGKTAPPDFLARRLPTHDAVNDDVP